MVNRFKGLYRPLNVAVQVLCNVVLPRGFDVAEVVPETFEGIKQHFKNTGRILVWSGASETTIYGERDINFSFRAWHDYVHISHNLSFEPEHEKQVCEIQKFQVESVYGDCERTRQINKYIHADVTGQVEYFQRFGKFPVDQKAFVSDYVETGKIYKRF